MTEIFEIMAGQIIPAIGVLMATLISIGMAYAIKWLKLKTGSEAVAAAGEIIATTVNDLTASTVKDLKSKAVDGHLTLKDAESVKFMAKTRIKNQMPNAVAKASVLAIGDLNAFIEGGIEREINKLKVKKEV